MKRAEKIALAIVALECVLLTIAERAVKKRGEDRLNKHFGVSTVDELMQKYGKRYYDKKE